MLVLSRKESEVIQIGHDISVIVVETNDYKCRLGVTAPSDISVHRKEVYDAIRKRDGETYRSRRTCWANINASGPGTTHDTKEEADACRMPDRVACKKISYSAGEFQ